MAVETRLEAQPLARRFLSLVNSIGMGGTCQDVPLSPSLFLEVFEAAEFPEFHDEAMDEFGFDGAGG